MKFFLHQCVLIGFVLVSFSAAHADSCRNPEVLDRPSVGLVLGGGGARGAAHIGVIRRLEELNIPIDYVVGTSMGALVGALYATGMDAAGLESTLAGLEWNELFTDNTARKERPFRRKRDDDLSLFGPKLGVGKNSSLLPRGAISGQKISFLFESLINERVQVTDYDDLPIPYRAVAADIATGLPVVIDSGNLALSMRASMSVPGVFDPVELDGNLLVDGGIANNLPIDVVRALGADRIIAIDVGTELTPRDELGTLLSVVRQMTSLLVNNNVQRQLATMDSRDILVRPEIGNRVSSRDFAKAAEAIEIGYQSALEHEVQLSDLSLQDSDYKNYRLKLESCLTARDSIQFVRLDNQTRFSDDVILERLHTKVGQPLDVSLLKADVERIYALGMLEIVRYELIRENGHNGIVVHAKQDSRGESFIEWGMNYSGDTSQTHLNLRLGLLKTDIDKLGSELRVLTQLGADPGAFVELNKLLDVQHHWSIRPKLFASRTNVIRFDKAGRALGSFEVDKLGASAVLAYEFDRFVSIYAGLDRVVGQFKVVTGNQTVPDVNFDDGRYLAGFQWDSMDDLYFPTSGSYLDVRFNLATDDLGSDFEYEQLTLNAGIAHTFGRHTLMGLARYETSFTDEVPLHALFQAGGYAKLSGFSDNELSGQHFGMAMLSYRMDLRSLGFLPAYAGSTLEYGNVASDRNEVFEDGLFNGSAFIGFRTPIGPLYVGVGFAEGGRQRFFLQVGNIFGRGDVSGAR